jgi:hypothetical protein
MAGVAFAVGGDGVGFATESYAASALYTTLASLSGALSRIRRARSRRHIACPRRLGNLGAIGKAAFRPPCGWSTKYATFPYYMLMPDRVRHRVTSVDFHMDYLHFPLFRETSSISASGASSIPRLSS